MHYKFKAMQKMLTAVGITNDFSQRPVFQKIKQVTSVLEPSSEEVSIIHDEMKNIETILASTEKEERNGSVSSKKLKHIMSPVNRKIIEAMKIYLSAWRMAAELHNIKPEDRTCPEDASAEKPGADEKSEISSGENDHPPSDEKSDIPSGENVSRQISAETVSVEKNETSSEEKTEDRIKSLEEKQSDRDELSENIIALAEKAEQMLCDIEKKITEVLDDNPIEG